MSRWPPAEPFYSMDPAAIDFAERALLAHTGGEGDLDSGIALAFNEYVAEAPPDERSERVADFAGALAAIASIAISNLVANIRDPEPARQFSDDPVVVLRNCADSVRRINQPPA